MAKLLIFRGEAKHAEVELTDKTLRVGRSPEDDIVLPDPSKGVSRTHAEIRFEGGRYVLVDHQSQNGIWVAGSRVASVALERGVVASVGPYRLMTEAPPAAEPVPAAEAQTEMIPRPQPPPAAPPPASAGRVAVKPAPRPRVPGPPKLRRWYEQPRWLAVIGAAVLVVAASGFAAYRFAQMQKPAFDLEAARAMVVGGNCQQAMVEHIDPALRANPNDTMALELKRQCAAPPPPPEPPPEPPRPTAAQQLDEAEALIAAKDCPKALEKINEVIATEPENERAKGLAAQANVCIAPPPPVTRVPADPLAVKLPPAEGGLDLLPKERLSAYQKRVADMRARYNLADSKIRKNECVQAVGDFEKIRKDVPDGYLALNERLRAARRCVTDEANKNLGAAKDAENRGDFDTAILLYRRANELDSSIKIDEPLQRIADQKLQLGRQKCTEGKAAYALGKNAAAIAAFTDVLRFLPPSDPCYATAQEQQKKAQELLKKSGK